MLCPECEARVVYADRGVCYPCHLASLGFTFRGPGGGWHGPTTRERQAEATSTNPNVEHI